MPKSMLQIGIAGEAETDIAIIKSLVSRILPDEGIDFSISREIKARTGIIGFIPAYTRTFFGSDQPVDLAIFVTDQDVPKSDDPRKKKIEQHISGVNSIYLDSSVIVVCDPHIESWLLADHNNVKRIFNLDHESELPGKGLTPKKQLENIVNVVEGNRPSLFDIYTNLADTFDIDAVCKVCKEFDDFNKELRSKSKRN